jgi:hypothetical protein
MRNKDKSYYFIERDYKSSACNCPINKIAAHIKRINMLIKPNLPGYMDACLGGKHQLTTINLLLIVEI